MKPGSYCVCGLYLDARPPDFPLLDLRLHLKRFQGRNQHYGWLLLVSSNRLYYDRGRNLSSKRQCLEVFEYYHRWKMIYPSTDSCDCPSFIYRLDWWGWYRFIYELWLTGWADGRPAVPWNGIWAPEDWGLIAFDAKCSYSAIRKGISPFITRIQDRCKCPGCLS